MNFIDPTICGWAPAPYLLISDNVTGFLSYSHLLPPLLAFIVTLVVVVNNPRKSAAWWLLFISTMFSLWCLTDLIIWATDRSDLIMFAWSSLIYLDLLIYVGAAYFMYSFIEHKNPPLWWDLCIVLIFIPLFLFAHTPLNLVAFDFRDCWRNAIEGPLWKQYVYVAELLITLFIIVFTIKKLQLPTLKERTREITITAIGITAMLTMFSLGNIAGTFNSAWDVSQWGLYGMPIFMMLLTYQLIRYHSFNTKLVSTDAFVAGQCILIATLLFVRSIEHLYFIAFGTLVITIALGVLLMHTMRREIRGRQANESLARNLVIANERLQEVDKVKTEFVSIASHQMRSPLTTIRSYASTLLDGSFGKLPPEAREAIEHIHESTKSMAAAIDDFLNTSRIESGNLKYEDDEFDLGIEVARVMEDIKPFATERGLTVGLESRLTEEAQVRADPGKVYQILHNLVHNAIKYTETGGITFIIDTSAEHGTVTVDVTDTGMGMSPETLKNLFTKFERDERARTIDPNGTGLGLYIARTMARRMHGDVNAFSQGEGAGSTFRLTLPLVKPSLA